MKRRFAGCESSLYPFPSTQKSTLRTLLPVWQLYFMLKYFWDLLDGHGIPRTLFVWRTRQELWPSHLDRIFCKVSAAAAQPAACHRASWVTMTIPSWHDKLLGISKSFRQAPKLYTATNTNTLTQIQIQIQCEKVVNFMVRAVEKHCRLGQ